MDDVWLFSWGKNLQKSNVCSWIMEGRLNVDVGQCLFSPWKDIPYGDARVLVVRHYLLLRIVFNDLFITSGCIAASKCDIQDYRNIAYQQPQLLKYVWRHAAASAESSASAKTATSVRLDFKPQPRHGKVKRTCEHANDAISSVAEILRKKQSRPVFPSRSSSADSLYK